MHNRQGEPASRLLRTLQFPSPFHSLWAAFACAIIILSGCASPSEPIERKPPVPQPVADLAAQQVGNSVAITFTVPTEAVDRRSLDQPPAIEIFRDFEPPAAASTVAGAASASKTAPAAPTVLLVTIPSAMVDTYVAQDHFRYFDALKPEEFSQHPPGSVAVYAVRTRTSQKKESAPSNIAALRIYALPDPIDDLKAEVTHSGIQLTWTPPTKTLAGPAPPTASYRIFRAESQPTASTQPPSAPSTAAQTTQAAPGAPLIKIAETQSPNYLDVPIQFGNTYAYSVRAVVLLEGHELESADSNRITIVARGTFPPAAPQGLLVVFVPAQAAEPAHLELSWAISSETDLAGYNVYRSEQAGGVQGTRLNTELLPTPAFQDMNAVPGRAHFYSVTAVDRSGNESPASTAVSGTVPAESQPTP